MVRLFPENMRNEANYALTLDSIASKLTYFHEQLHLLHWQTSSYARHMALGSIYEYVHDFKDGLIEKIMGYTNTRPGLIKMLPMTNTTEDSVINELLSFASELKAYGEKNSFHDVCNLADALSGEAAKTKYLFSLS